MTLELDGVPEATDPAATPKRKPRWWLRIIAAATGLTLLIPEAGDFGAAYGAAKLARACLSPRFQPEDFAAPGLRAEVQPDPALRYAWGDMHAGRTPHIVAAGYTYNQRDDKLTTNYAIDAALGTLVLQGSREGTQPMVSPNTGQLRTVGSLGLGPLEDASFDIADVNNTALLAARTGAHAPTVLYRVDLDTGRARALGVVGDGAPLRGLAIVP